jgi:16S rRNA (adenine1518-N6/adenine1519-N6)-dimethyltransferase
VAVLPRPRKSLGQHFLTDRRILARIAEAAELTPQETVIEIGAGTGTLTTELASRCRLVIAVEKDPRLVERLRQSAAATPARSHVQVVAADFLRPGVHWEDFRDSAGLTVPPKFVGNIPYALTTPIIEAVLRQRPPLVVLLVQEEVAARVVAAPGSRTYGGLSVGVGAVAHAEKVFSVRPGAFVPAPAVRSAVLRLRLRPEPLLPWERLVAFRRFVTACFGRRRKQLHNVLRGGAGWPVATVAAVLERLGLDPRARPETLSPEDFVRLFEAQP